MSRLPALDPATATGRTKALFDDVQSALGRVPNLMRTLANAPAALEGYLALGGALRRGALTGRLGEQIALTVAGANECDYCLAAHAALGQGEGLSPQEIERARRAESADARARAVLQFTTAVLASRGAVADADLAAIRGAGFTDAEITEVIAHVALNVYTNYLNRLAQTVIDFPRLPAAA